jgi:hypothetical protein
VISRKTRLAGAALLAMCGLAQGHDAPERPRIERAMEAFAQLEAAHPGVHRYVEDGTISVVYGAPMNQGDTPMQAAAAWLEDWSGVFGAGELELTLNEEVQLKNGKLTAFLFSQTIEGVPVDSGVGRILVRNDIERPTVVYGAGRLADRPADAGAIGAGDFAQVPVDAARALARVQRMPSFRDLAQWTDPELVWHYAAPNGERPVARLSWAFYGSSDAGPDGPQSYRFFIDARTGALLEARWSLHDIDVEGQVQANAHTTLSPFGPIGPVPVPSVEVRTTGGGATAVTEDDGTFVIPNPGTGFVNVAAGVFGPWCRIIDLQGDLLTVSVGVTPPGPADLLLNKVAPDEFTTAQVNALIGVNSAHNLITNRAIGFQALNRQVMTHVNDGSGSCNAFFMPADLSLTFYREGGGCQNAAYSTVVSHEYGHFIVNRLGLLQGGFGEGYSDSVSVVLWDTGIIAQDFFGPGAHIRDLTVRPPRFSYPCVDESHNCGEVLAGAWRQLRQNVGATHGVTDGLDLARDLFVGWSMITLGATGFDSATPRTVVEILTIDDDDWYIENGTPNWEDVASAFAVFDINPPILEYLAFSFPDGLPDLLTPGAATDLRVEVRGLRKQPDPFTGTTWDPIAGTGELTYSINGTTPVTVSMTQIGTNLYRATLPALTAFQNITYHFGHAAKRGTQERRSTWPPDAPAKGITAIAGYPVVKENFETGAGWTVESRDLTSGAWERGVPRGWGSSGEPPRDYDWSGQCFLTENFVGDHDVDGGPTRLISPVYDLSELDVVNVSYARWFFNDDRDIDRMTIEMSGNGGISWKAIEVLPHQEGWQLRTWRVPAPNTLPELTNRFRLRVSVSDDPNNSVTEGGFDRFWILSNVAVCRVDLDGDGDLTFFDFLAFQDLFAAGDSRADFDGDGALTFFDFLTFQDEYVAGCP